MTLQLLLDYCKAKAIGESIRPDDDTIYREFCRTYSETFHTPLLQVYDLDPEHVILNVFEHQLKDYDTENNLNPLIEQINRIANPNFDSDEEEALQDYIKDLQAKEDKTKEPEKKPEEEVVIPEDAPKSGGVDFSDLNDEG